MKPNNNTILNDEDYNQFYKQLLESKQVEGNTAEIGVFNGLTSKLIHSVLERLHFCYDTFEGIVNSNQEQGDKHSNGEYLCDLQTVKSNINMSNVIYKIGYFPDTFEEHLEKFCFVYSDTATYYGAKETLDKFAQCVSPGGKIIFYSDNNCAGVKKAIDEFIKLSTNTKYNFVIKNYKNLIVFTKQFNT